METILKTRFPIFPVDERQVFGVVGQWIVRNRDFLRYFGKDAELLEKISTEPEVFEAKGCKARITKTTLDINKLKFSAFEFQHPGADEDDTIRLKFAYARDCEDKVAEASFVLDHGCTHFHKVMTPNKPNLVNMLIDSVPQSMDGWIPFTTKPLHLVSADAKILADYINGIERGNMLPVLYVCRLNRDNSLVLDPDHVAKKLGGLAHVFVEPDHNFSRDVKSALRSREMICYDGAVRIYWPGAEDPRMNKFWLKETFANGSGSFGKVKDPCAEIMDYIISRTTGLSLGSCSYESIVGMKKRLQVEALYKAMRVEGEEEKKSHAEMVSLSEQIITSHENEKQDLEGQIKRLMYDNTTLREDLKIAQMNLQDYRSHIDSNPPSEELATNSDVLLALNSFLDRNKDSDSLSPYYEQRLTQFLMARSGDVEQALADREEIIDVIGTAFRGYTRLNAHCVSALTKCGFGYTEAGSHYKIIRKGFSPDIFVTLSKTPGDRKTGEHFIKDMRNTFFNI